MSKHYDGGPAFARDSHIEAKAGLIVRQNGMSLRDYFAAAALSAMCTRTEAWCAQEMARNAYIYADAMLDQRAKRKEAQP